MWKRVCLHVTKIVAADSEADDVIFSVLVINRQEAGRRELSLNEGSSKTGTGYRFDVL
jgi:hypothetical protein